MVDNTQYAISQLTGTLYTNPFAYRFMFKEDKYIYDQLQIGFNKLDQHHAEISYFAGYIQNKLQQFEGYSGDTNYYYQLDDSFWIKNVSILCTNSFGWGYNAITVCFMNFEQNISCQTNQYDSAAMNSNATYDYKIDETHYYDLVGFYGAYYIDELHYPLANVYNNALIKLIINGNYIF